jgi:hypothetical protein
MFKVVTEGPPGDWQKRYSPVELEVRLKMTALVKTAAWLELFWTWTTKGPAVTPADQGDGVVKNTNLTGGSGVAVGVEVDVDVAVLVPVLVAVLVDVEVGVEVSVWVAVFVAVFVPVCVAV